MGIISGSGKREVDDQYRQHWRPSGFRFGVDTDSLTEVITEYTG